MSSLQDLLWGNTILIKKQEHFMSVFLRFWKNIALFFLFLFMFSYILYISLSSVIIPIFLIILWCVGVFFYTRMFYKDTFIVVTQEKILKSVRNGLFSSHIIELPLSRVRQIRANNNGIFAKIFGYWDIEIQGFEESSNMYFKSLSENTATMNKISEIIANIQKK